MKSFLLLKNEFLRFFQSKNSNQLLLVIVIILPLSSTGFRMARASALFHLENLISLNQKFQMIDFDKSKDLVP
jgi:hypothetical protein